MIQTYLDTRACSHDFDEDPACEECGMHASESEQHMIAEIRRLALLASDATKRAESAELALSALREAQVTP